MMLGNEEKLKNLLKTIEKERKYTGEPGHPHHEGATLVLNRVQEKTELVLSKLKEIKKLGESEETGTNNDWIFRLMRYLIRLNDIAIEGQKGDRRSIYRRSVHAYSAAMKDEAKKSFTEFAPVFEFEGDLAEIDSYSVFLEAMRSQLEHDQKGFEDSLVPPKAKDVERI